METVGAEWFERRWKAHSWSAKECPDLTGDKLAKRKLLHLPRSGRGAEREIVTGEPGAKRTERRAADVHRAEVQRHSGPAQRRFDDILDGRIDGRGVRVHH